MSNDFKPYVAPEQNIPEFTWIAALLGIVLAIVMGASNAYLGLYAGMTVSASIPAAVISMAILRGVLRRGNILQNNIVQTIASAGESLAAGIIFTVPALVLVGVWQDFKFWPTTLIAICGGILGVIFMIPMRRALIVEDKTLTYPEGLACAEVLTVGEEGGTGVKSIGIGLAIGATLKFFSSGMGILKGSLEWATKAGNSAWFFGSEVSAALVGVGYIVRLRIAILMFIGAALVWFVTIPWLGISGELVNQPVIDAAYSLWKTKVRFMGVGGMLVGGVWSLVSARHGIVHGFKGLRGRYQGQRGERPRTDQDMNLSAMATILGIVLVLMVGLYYTLLKNWELTIVTSIAMIVASFFFVAVSSYIVGLVGNSKNPVSGMTICAVMGTSAFLLALGMSGNSAIIATLGVAGVVCCAACMAGDCSQDLKTGLLVGATPRKQQWAEIVAILVSAFVMAPTLTLLHSAYGIGTGLKAPQATLFASIAGAFFGDGEKLPFNMVYIGMVIGVVLVCLNIWLEKSGKKFRTHVMPVAIGMYLPLTLTIPILLGALVRASVDSLRERQKKTVSETKDHGLLLCAGFIAGEAIMGILIAILISLKWADAIKIANVSDTVSTGLAIVALVTVLWYLRKQGLTNEKASP